MKLSLDHHKFASCDAETPPLSTPEVIAKFRDEIRSHGLEPPEVIEPGKRTRGPGYGKGPRNDAASYLLFEDGRGGHIEDFSTGLKKTWFVNSNARKSASSTQTKLARQEAAQAKKKWQEEEAARHAQAATKAQALWDRAQPASDWHPYLKRKRIQPHNLRATRNGELLAPVYDRDGKLSSVQRIFEKEGEFEKRFLSGGATGGDCHFVIGGPDEYLSGAAEGMEKICIAEGVATAASIYEKTGYPTVVAFSANKLEPVARLTRERHPNAHITVCADNDAGTEAKGGEKPRQGGSNQGGSICKSLSRNPASTRGEISGLQRFSRGRGGRCR